MVQLIESIPDFDAVIASNKLVVVDFYAEWCGPCRLIAPFIEQLNKDTEDVVFIKVDVDILHDLAVRYSVQAMPTFAFFKNGEVVKTVVGADKNNITNALVALRA